MKAIGKKQKAESKSGEAGGARFAGGPHFCFLLFAFCFPAPEALRA
jgi:hypothetical protein